MENCGKKIFEARFRARSFHAHAVNSNSKCEISQNY